MSSLRFRMLAALCLVIALAWAISIAMFVSYIAFGQTNVWRTGLHTLGQSLVRALPNDWNAKNASTPSSGREHTVSQVGDPPSAKAEPNEPASILTAMLLNTIELGLVGLLTWWALAASLRPLTTVSGDLAKRDPFDSTPLATQAVPSELRPLILAFNSLLKRVELAMRAERNFIADAAHELRTPLAALHMHAEVALRAKTIDSKNDAINKLIDVSHRTQRLAEQLLDLARLESGLHTDSEQPTDLVSLSAHVISEFSVQAQAYGTAVVLTGEPCLVNCDVDEIGILLRNLLDNALRHGKPFGTINVLCGNETSAGSSHAFLEVRDDGPGVPKHEHAAIFERFYRANNSVGRGSGIGLSLVADIARLHGATIRTNAGALRRGLSIRIVFPAAKLV